MTSDDSAELDLERGLPTTAADVVALSALPEVRLTTAQYLQWLRQFEVRDTSVLRDRPGPRGDEPFRL